MTLAPLFDMEPLKTWESLSSCINTVFNTELIMLRSFQYEAEQSKETGDKTNQIHQILLHTESTK